MFAVSAILAGLAVWLWLPDTAGRLREKQTPAWQVKLRAGLLRVAAAIGLEKPVSSKEEQRRAAVIAELPKLPELLSVCLDAGLPTRTGVEVLSEVLTGPLADSLKRVNARVQLGADEQEVWTAAASDPALCGFAFDFARCLGAGTAQADTLRRLAARLREQSVATLQVKARKVGVRSVMPLMVCFLPAFVLLGIVPIVVSLFAHVFGG
ncbi:MAG: type II secretion system F family protein [Propionibacteriaceae bacterium]|jgi:pilus assembly protein TadC|nr:type II secretion system F family protein [Propionibacteriaceae bacterium]